MVELLGPEQSKVKFFLHFLLSLWSLSGARDRVGEPYAIPLWVILA